MVQTIEENKSNYTGSDYKKACLVRTYQRRFAYPDTKTIAWGVDTRQFENCGFTKPDIVAALHIFGPQLGQLKGKTVRKTPEKVDMRIVPISAAILDRYKEVNFLWTSCL